MTLRAKAPRPRSKTCRKSWLRPLPRATPSPLPRYSPTMRFTSTGLCECASLATGAWPVNGAPPFSLPDAGDSTAVRLSAPGAVRHDVAHQVAHVVLQISDDVLDDVSDRDHAHDLARVQHW